MKRISLTAKLLFISLFISLTINAQEQKVKNIILLIGDGMGIAQVYAGMVSSPAPLNIERMKTVGFSKTYSANDFTTDSSAGGTALACGVKTNNGMVGMSPDTVAVNSIMQIAKNNDLATGLVVSCNVTHATPASFVAHQPSRSMTEAIAADYLKSGIDVFIGGGRNDFEKRKDGRNLSEELRSKDYTVVHTLEAMNRVQSGKMAALLADNHPGKAAERDNLLVKGVYKSLELLSKNEKGFFLMVEGSQIDWAGHVNQSDYVVNEVLDFDKAVGVALDFADRNPGTLVVVVADHETGGLTLPKGDIAKRTFKAKFSTLKHTGVPVPIYSYGTGSEIFGGFMQNTGVFDRMLQSYGFGK
ncbi:MAG: alkaline phosphatase [Prevotellaceae bacterium]|jgi:alkaline phosphatase|nr:alkaline phosphatase [Prevotellaceae bacterium]